MAYGPVRWEAESYRADSSQISSMLLAQVLTASTDHQPALDWMQHSGLHDLCGVQTGVDRAITCQYLPLY